MRWIFITLFSTLLFSAVLSAYAATDSKCEGVGCIETYTTKVGGDAGYSTVGGDALLPTAAGLIVQGLLGLLGVIFLILIIAGGYQWMTAGGAEEKITKSKGLITNAVIGLAIVLGSYMLYAFIGQYLGI